MHYLYIYVATLLLSLLAGCENSMDPFDEEEGLYSIYGYLNLHEDVNFIRIKDLNETLQNSDEDLDAKVTFENLNDGSTQILQDTIVEFDGVKTHNFRTTMDINPDTEYRVTAERSDGKTTSATATTPYIAETSVNPMGANCSTSVNMSFEPVRSKHSLWVEVGFYYRSNLLWVQINRMLVETGNRVYVSFTPGLIIDLEFPESAVACEHLSDDVLEVRYTHYGPDLFEETVSDTLDVPGGAGRFGALYRDSFTFPIDTMSLCPPMC